ncbi:MAG: FAD-dependent thymidylate synthase [Candidatus ainarchaeum sp.]|nr:FAD-dependent thymidylate synthase [Candidatus ainarchaeum sp.]
MEITLVEKNDEFIEELEKYLQTHNLNEASFNELAKIINFSFSIENCSRLLSHHICEGLDSYTQQSQRYVKMGETSFIVPNEIIGNELENEYKKNVLELIDFYRKITQVNEGFCGRKATTKDYLYGIKIEDGRYILPLATTTNVFVTLNFSKIINFFKTIKRLDNAESKELLEKIKQVIGKEKIIMLIEKFSENRIQEEQIIEFEKKQFEKINEENNVILINNFENSIIRSALGAITSTSEDTPSKIKLDWSENALEKSKGITQRVMGYGHTSIIEHARTNFGLMMSLTCYHQFERHRLPSNIREQFENIPLQRNVIIPESIQQNNEILKEFENKIKQIKEFRKKLIEKKLQTTANYLLLNCDIIKLISSTNARMDNDILSERTCNNAQWEIRNLYNKKLELLKQTAPIIYDQAGPPCTKGICPEGTLTCGKIIEMRKKYGYFGK